MSAEGMGSSEYPETLRLRPDLDPIDHDGPWLVTSSGAALGRGERLTTRTLPPHQIDVEVQGNPAIHGTVAYDVHDLMYVGDTGWLIDLVRETGIPRAGDLLVQREEDGPDPDPSDDIDRELEEMLSGDPAYD